jgi:LCP family protein required for cell wall assembly
VLPVEKAEPLEDAVPLGDAAPLGDPGQRTPSRWRRARKVILIVAAVVVVLVAGTASATYLVTNHYLNSMKRIHNPFASIPAAERPPRPAGAAANDMTFLVGGVDTRSPVPTTGKSAASDARGRTDTLMLVRFIAGGRSAYVVSIPRDSWVPIPGYGDGKVNWAYFYGGPTLAVRTVEKLTGVRVDHVAIIDWDGFRSVTDALGGVTVDVPVTTYDPANHITWTAGTHHLNGAQALLYVRDRYGLASGDFARERRQQYFLRAVLKQLRKEGKLTNPLQTTSVLRALTGAVSVDSTLGNGQITSLALSLRGLNLTSVVFATVPNAGTGTVGSQSVVRLNQKIDPGFWHAFEYDTLPAYMRAHGVKQLGASTP